MVTLTFILIAYLIRKRYLIEDSSTWDKILYYTFCVVLTPVLGPWFMKKLTDHGNSDNSGSDEYGYTYPGFL
jgi:hypothetical protein